MSNRTYRVVVTREAGAWLADVPDVPGTHTWARSLSALDREVREVIAMQEDLAEGAEAGLDIAYEYEIGAPELVAKAAALRVLRERLERDERELTEGTAATVERLTRDDYSVRDVAALLAISPQRVSQLQPRPKSPVRSRTAVASTGRVKSGAAAKTGKAASRGGESAGKVAVKGAVRKRATANEGG